MDKPRHQSLFQHSMEPGYGTEVVPHPSIPDQTGSTIVNIPSPTSDVSDVKTVQNYSIQTGEEFALEFMRDRVIPQMSSNPTSTGEMNYNTGYMELRGLIGISHTGSECASEASRFSTMENGMRDNGRTNASLHEFGNKLGHVQLAPQASMSKDWSVGNLHGYAASSSSSSVTPKVKILCSFGGKILPRPSDSKLRYVGGETHLVSIRKDISWLELRQKVLKIYDQTRVVKYQLPGEEIDTLVSVSCEEDIQNMLEEYNLMENYGGSQNIRMFLFSINDMDDALLGINKNEGESEFQYVVAVNGMDIKPGKNSTLHGLNISSAKNLAELDVLNTEEINTIAGDVRRVGVSQLLNHSSKSDNPPGSQLVASQSQENTTQQDKIGEAVGKSHDNFETVNDVIHQKHQDVKKVFEKVRVSNEALESEPLHKIVCPENANKNIEDNGADTEIGVPNLSHVIAIKSHIIPDEQAYTRGFVPLHGDILIDINDRFPHDFLSKIFSHAISEDTSAVHPHPDDGVSVSMNVHNHNHKNWSYFQQLEEQFSQRDVAIDQVDSQILPDRNYGGESSRLPHVSPLGRNGISTNLANSQMVLGQDYGGNIPKSEGGGNNTIPPAPEDEQMKVTESEEFGAMVENLRTPDTEPKGEKTVTRQDALPPFDSEFDYSGLQIIKNDDLEELKELGSGTFGTVYHGKWRGSDVAIKRIKKNCFAGKSSEKKGLTSEFLGEARILSKLHHPNVVAFYGVVKDGPGGTLATVTEYMVDGSLRHVLVRKDMHLDRRKKLIIAMDAAFGMEYLHSKNTVHFDLKCDNLLVNLKDSSRPICKVGDFGLSKMKRTTLVSGGLRGTLPWMAPELLNGSNSKVSEKVDVFSFGIVLWEILTGDEPYADMVYGAIIGGIVNNTLRPPIPSFCDDEWRTLMEECWAPNPMARPSFTEIANRLRVMSSASTSTQSKPPAHRTSK